MSRTAISGIAALALMLAAGTAVAQKRHYAPVRPLDPVDESPVVGIEPEPAVSSVVIPGHGIDYHGGAVMTPASGDGIVNLYFIWYGNWTNGARASDSPNTRDLL